MVAPTQLSTALGDDAVILDLKKGNYYGVNEVGAVIWNFIQERRSVAEICERIRQQYEVGPQQCERDVLAWLARMEDAGLIEVSDAAP